MNPLKKIITTTLLLTIVTMAFGQQKKNDRKAHKEKIQAMKVGYITEKINLTTAEAQQFWPIYNEYDAKMDALRKSMRKMHKQEASINEMSDVDVENMINTINDTRQKELNTQKEYLQKFKSVLPIKKVAKLYKAEHGFKRKLLKKLKVKKGGPNDLNIPPPPPGKRH